MTATGIIRLLNILRRHHLDHQFIIRQFQQELKNYQKLLEKTSSSLKNQPEGHLKTVLCKNKFPQYYWIKQEWKDTHPNGKYLSVNDKAIAEALANKEYNLKLSNILKDQIALLHNFIKTYHPEKLQEAYTRLAPAKKLLVQPYLIPDDEFLTTWYGNYSGSQNPFEFESTNPTDRGELVRSKSEMIIANKLFHMDIPYKYEAALQLGDKTVYPDFSVLNLRTRKTILYEHLGMIDQPEYCQKCLKKIDTYIQNDYIPGKNLLITTESSLKPMNFSVLDKLISLYFL